MRPFLICLLLLSTALCALPPFAYFERPTPAQIEQYYLNKAANPELYSYNPLQVGNKWFYSGWSAGPEGDVPISYHCGREITADSLINGKMHYYVFSQYTFEQFWEYNQGDSLMAYTQMWTAPYDYTDQLFWLFEPGSSFQPYWNGWEITCQEYGLVNIFGETVTAVYFFISASNVSIWAERFGPLSHGFDFGQVTLIGCIIDNVIYGDVSNPDEPLPSPLTLNLLLYPNPFTDNLNLKAEQSSFKPVDLSIYNLKGQLIRNWSRQKISELNWNGKDAQGMPVAAGIYIIQASDGSHSVCKKVLKLR
ncbi:MAG: T9SS type A sorting domain-containing protein [Candidatus Cloacimonadaceae bacterium]